MTPDRWLVALVLPGDVLLRWVVGSPSGRVSTSDDPADGHEFADVGSALRYASVVRSYEPDATVLVSGLRSRPVGAP